MRVCAFGHQSLYFVNYGVPKGFRWKMPINLIWESSGWPKRALGAFGQMLIYMVYCTYMYIYMSSPAHIQYSVCSIRIFANFANADGRLAFFCVVNEQWFIKYPVWSHLRSHLIKTIGMILYMYYIFHIPIPMCVWCIMFVRNSQRQPWLP